MFYGFSRLKLLFQQRGNSLALTQTSCKERKVTEWLFEFRLLSQIDLGSLCHILAG